MKLMILGMAVSLAAFAQQPVQYDGRNNPNLPRYEYRATSSSGITVQSCSTCGPMYLETVDVTACSADATLTFSQNGTAATTTAGAWTNISPAVAGPPPSVYTNTNVGSGTTLKTFAVGAATATSGPQTYDISMFVVPAGGPTSNNWTLKVSTGTCTFQITGRTKFQ